MCIMQRALWIRLAQGPCFTAWGLSMTNRVPFLLYSENIVTMLHKASSFIHGNCTGVGIADRDAFILHGAARSAGDIHII